MAKRPRPGSHGACRRPAAAPGSVLRAYAPGVGSAAAADGAQASEPGVGAAGSAAASSPPLPGPSSRSGIMQCMEDYCKALPPADLESLLNKLESQGLHVITDYSGSGQAEHACQRLRDLARDSGRQPRVHCARASDINPDCRKVLQAFNEKDMCVMGDIISRQSARFQKRLHAITVKGRAQLQSPSSVDDTEKVAQKEEQIRKMWLASVARLIHATPCSPEDKAWCDEHEQRCAVVPPASDDDCLSIRIAGISCLDWSSRGSRRKTIGTGALAWASFLRETWWSEPDMVLLECTRSYRHADLDAVMGSKYSLTFLVFSPTQVGVPSERYRKYMVMIKKDGRLRWHSGCELSESNFLKIFGRSLSVNGHVYLLESPGDLVRAELARWSARRHLPEKDKDGLRFQFAELLTRKGRRRLQAWKDRLHARGHDDEQEQLFCDLAQSPDYGNLTTLVPALTRKNMPWSLFLNRPVLPSERLEIMGWPAINPEATLGLGLPWKSAIPSSPAKIASLTGNAMHFASVSLVLAYTLAFTEVV